MIFVGLGGVCVLLVAIIIAAVVDNASGRGSGSSAPSSASAAPSTTPLGCELPDSSDGAQSDRWINCTERELARRLCGQDTSSLEVVRPNSLGDPYQISDYSDPGGAPIQFYYPMSSPEPKTLACNTGTHTISVADWQTLSRAGTEADLPPELR